jgi:ABC-type glycerol-3-phosphate transport system substrate-binding protein
MRRLTRNIVLSAETKNCLGISTVTFAMIAAALTGCGSTPAAVDKSQAPTVVPTLAPVVTATSAALSTSAPLTVTSTGQVSIMVWWPAALYPDEKSAAAQTLRRQLENFTAASHQTVTVRVKRNDGLGSVYQTLLSGSAVAQSAMPDLALMRRSDLAQAVAAKLVVQIDSKVLSLTDFYPAGLALGQVNGNQYGIPYVLEVQQTLYRTTALPIPPRSTDDLIASGQPILFPAGVVKGVDTTFLQQYLAAGGHIADDKGAPTLDAGPLKTVLSYYGQAVSAKIVGPQLLDYTNSTQYWQTFLSGKANLVQVDSTTYLAQRANLTNVGTLPVLVPASGALVSAVDGWLWVVTTSDPDRQAQALSLLNWLVQSDQQAAFTHAIGVLPSQRSALTAWGDDKYAAFAATLLEQPSVPAQDMIDPGVAAALQAAFDSVLNGRKTADVAASDAVASVGK